MLIKNFTRRALPSRVPFSRVAEAVLPSWEISLVVVGRARAKTLNQRLRNKDYVPNVLSYKLGDHHGEIIICLEVAERQAPSYGLSFPAYIFYLFIHGLLHIKGGVHGATMEKSEQRLLSRFLPQRAGAKSLTRPLTHVTTHSNRHRHRHIPGKSGRGRRAHR